MPDGILSIGATFDKSDVIVGMDSLAENVQANMADLSVVVERSSARTRAAAKGMSEDVKTLAATVDESYVAQAIAIKEATAAHNDLRRAVVLSKDASVDAAVSTNLLAAALQRDAEKSAVLAAAKMPIVVANEEVAASAGAVGNAFQRSAVVVTEATAVMKARLVGVAETGKLSAQGIGAGFSGLGALLGGGMLVGFAAHFLDEAAKMNVELSHVAEQTGLTIAQVSGLQLLVKEMGGDWEAVSKSLFKMEVAEYGATHGGAKLAEAFASLGITQDQLKNSSPIEMLQLVSSGMSRLSDETARAHATQEIFGRGGKVMIPVFEQYGDTLAQAADNASKLTGATERVSAASLKWTQDMAYATAVFHHFGNVVIESMHYVQAAILNVWNSIKEALMGIGLVVAEAITAIVGAHRVLYDVEHGNFSKMQEDASSYWGQMKDGWKNYRKVLSDDAKAENDLWKTPAATPVVVKKGGQKKDDSDADNPAAAKGSRSTSGRSTSGETAFQQDEKDLKKLEQNHALTLQEEIDFWNKRLGLVDAKSKDYRDILGKITGLRTEQEKPAKDRAAIEAKQWQGALAVMAAGVNADIALEQKAAREKEEIWADEQREKIKDSEFAYRQLERQTQLDVEFNRITSDRRLAILRDAAGKEFDLKQQLGLRLQKIDEGNMKKVIADQNMIAQAFRAMDGQVLNAQRQAAQASAKEWKKAFVGIQGAIKNVTHQFNSDVAQWVVTGKGFKSSMSAIASSVEKDFINSVLGMTEKFIAGELTKLAQATLSDSMLKMLHLTSAAETKATNSATNVQAAVSYSAVAEAAAASAVAGIPIVGPALAAAAYASMAALTAPAIAMAAFEHGGVVAGSLGAHVPILAHAGERVLTPEQSRNFHSLVNQSNDSRSSSVTQHNSTTINGSHMSAKDITRAVQDGIRRGRFRMA